MDHVKVTPSVYTYEAVTAPPVTEDALAEGRGIEDDFFAIMYVDDLVAMEVLHSSSPQRFCQRHAPPCPITSAF